MENVWPLLTDRFTLGLLLGLLIAAFLGWNGWQGRRALQRDLKRTAADLRELQGHLNTQLKISSTGSETLQRDLDELRRQNENMRVNFAALQQKPGRAEVRHLQLMEAAVRLMREQAPGFAPAWEQALRQAENECQAAESGLRKLVRRVIPGIGTSASPPAPLIAADEHKEA